MTTDTTTTGEARFSRPQSRAGFLRLVLKLDAIASGAIGAAFLALSTVLEELLGIRASLTLPVGVVLLAWAGVVWWIASRSERNEGALWAVILVNLAWVAASAALIMVGGLPLTRLGVAFVVLQGGAVAVFADLQYLGMRRARGPA